MAQTPERPAAPPGPRPRWAWRIGSLAGIPIHVHATFLLLPLWVVWRFGGEGAGEVFRYLALIVALFFCVVLHELGHALAARRFGVETRDITLLPIGGLARLERLPEQPAHELVVALAGPLVNVVIAGVLTLVLAATASVSLLVSADPQSPEIEFLLVLLGMNVFLAAFNMLPAFPMDGGRVLRALLAIRLPLTRATDLAAAVGKVMAVGFALLSFLNPMLLLIAVFVWFGASFEARRLRVREALQQVPTAQAMVTEFRSLGPWNTLAQAALWARNGWQGDFPVLDDGRLLGMLTREDLLSGLDRHGGSAPVTAGMRTDLPPVEAADPLAQSLGLLQGSGIRSLPVLSKGLLVGILTLDRPGGFGGFVVSRG